MMVAIDPFMRCESQHLVDGSRGRDSLDDAHNADFAHGAFSFQRR